MEFDSRILEKLEIQDVNSINIVYFILKLFGYSQTKPPNYKLQKNIFFFHNDFDKKLFYNRTILIQKILIKSISPMSIAEIEFRLNDLNKKTQPSLIQLICQSLIEIEQVSDEKNIKLSLIIYSPRNLKFTEL